MFSFNSFRRSQTEQLTSMSGQLTSLQTAMGEGLVKIGFKTSNSPKIEFRWIWNSIQIQAYIFSIHVTHKKLKYYLQYKKPTIFWEIFRMESSLIRIKNVESIKENKLSSIWQKNCCSYPTGEIEWAHLLFGDSSPVEQRGNSDWSRRSSQDDGRSIDRNDVTTFQTTTKDRYSMNL